MGMSSPSGEAVPGLSPSEASQARVAAMVSGVGPNRPANSPACRYRWYWGEPGVDTAATKASSAAGSRGWRATSAVTVTEESAGPTTEAPVGRVGVGPANRTEGAPPGAAASAARPGPMTPTAATTTRIDSAVAAVGRCPCRFMADSLAYPGDGGSSRASGSGAGGAAGRVPVRHRARRSATTAS